MRINGYEQLDLELSTSSPCQQLEVAVAIDELDFN